MKKSVFILFLISYCVYGQDFDLSTSGRLSNSPAITVKSFTNSTLRANFLGNKASFENNNEVLGTPYMLKDWVGNLTFRTNNGKIFKVSNANFDKFNQKFVVKISKDSIYEFGHDNIDFAFLSVSTDTLKFKKVYLNDDLKKSLVDVLIENKKASFYKVHKSRVKEGSKNPMTNQKVTKDKLVDSDEYYLKVNNKIKLIRLKEKSFRKRIKEFRNLKTYAANNSLSFKKEKDVVKIINYYNSL